jgi:1,4-dihydroxy-2-naphthoate octaprenyltransferase
MSLPSFSALWMGIRPKTLTMSLMPVLVAYSQASIFSVIINPQALFFITLAALCIQIGTNLHNDAADYLNGTDDENRIGPQRITQSGLAAPEQTRKASYLFFAIAICCGFYLAWLGGWPIILIGLTSVLAGIGYSAGPYPISRSPLGEIFVLTFFGLFAVGGTFYLLTGSIIDRALIGGLCVGLLACGVLLINNYRDLENDKLAGRKTLAILIGNNGCKLFYIILMLAPFFILPRIGISYFSIFLPLFAVFIAFRAIYLVLTLTDKQNLNRVLALSAATQTAMCLLYSIGLLLDYGLMHAV